MPRRSKLLARVRNNPNDVRFTDLLTLVEAFGFVRKPGQSGSHRQFRQPATGDLLNLQPDQNGKAKPYQVRQFLRTIDERELRLDEEDA